MFPFKKIVVTTAFPRDYSKPRGGVETVSVNLVKALAKHKDIEVNVVTFSGDVGSVQTEIWNDAIIHRLPYTGKKILQFSVGKGRAILKSYIYNLKCDLVHAHDTYGIMIHGLTLPRIFTVHGFIYEDTRYEKTLSAFIRSLIWEWVEKRSWAEKPHIISIAPYVHDRLRTTVKGKIYNISNPVDEAFFAVQPKPYGKIIFTSALLIERKNIIGLLKAFKDLVEVDKEVQLRIAGAAVDTNYKQKIDSFILQNGLYKNVFLLGSLSQKEIIAELSKTSVYALVSFEEGAPMGIAEAMAAQIPIVTSDRCGMPSMVSSNDNGFLVDPLDSVDIMKNLKRILDNAELQRTLGQNGRKRALDQYHPDIVANKTLYAYTQLFAS